MFNATPGVSAVLAQKSRGASPLAAMAISTAASLTLELPATVRPILTLGANPFWASLALVLDDLHLLQRCDWKGEHPDPRAVCLSALQRWITAQVVDLRCMQAKFYVSGFLDQFTPFDLGTVVETRKIDSTRPHAVFALEAEVTNDLNIYCIGPALTQLQGLVPGLGEALLLLLDQAGWRTVPLLTPAWAFDHVAQYYWEGETSQTEVIELLSELHQVTAEAIADEGYYTPATFETTTPRWALVPSTKFSRQRWASLRTHASAKVRAVSASAYSLAHFQRTKQFLMDCDGIEPQIVGAGCCLRWSEDDPVLRVFDDLMNDLMQGDGYTEITGIEVVSLDAASFRRFFRQLQRGFAHLRALDSLIAHLALPDVSKDSP